MILSRRSVLVGLLAAPIVVRAGLVMPIKAIDDLEARQWMDQVATILKERIGGGPFAVQFRIELVEEFKRRQSLLDFRLAA